MGTIPRACHCRIQDWAAIRHALGLTQPDFATLLSVSLSTVQSLEKRGQHHCPMRAVVQNLRITLLHDECQARLRAAGIAYPYPDDLEDE